MRYHPDFVRTDEGYRPKLIGSRVSRRLFPSKDRAVKYRIAFFERWWTLKGKRENNGR